VVSDPTGGASAAIGLPRWTLPELALVPRPDSADSDWAAIPGRALVLATDGSPLRQATTVRAAWHAESLLVRFECADADAWGTYRERDDPLWREEVVELFLAPGEATPGRYVEIEISPHGTLFDAWIDNPDGSRTTMRSDVAWNWPGLLWRVGRLGAADDWWAELQLPLRALVPAPSPLPDRWRANFYRVERPRRPELPEELGAWSPTLRDPPDFHVPERFGLIVREG
jgi:hypothetical protein